MQDALALVAALAAALAVGLAPAAGRREPLDYAGVALNVLPPGQSGSLLVPAERDRPARALRRADADARRRHRADVTRFFKSARFGAGRPRRAHRPPARRACTIVRDRWGVPHVYGQTRADVMFGAGWATAEDRGLLLNAPARPGTHRGARRARARRLRARDVRARSSCRARRPSAFLAASDRPAARRRAPTAAQVLRDVDAYVAGINAYNRRAGLDIRLDARTTWSPWRR